MGDLEFCTHRPFLWKVTPSPRQRRVADVELFGAVKVFFFFLFSIFSNIESLPSTKKSRKGAVGWSCLSGFLECTGGHDDCDTEA